jgi:hypothetical protein
MGSMEPATGYTGSPCNAFSASDRSPTARRSGAGSGLIKVGMAGIMLSLVDCRFLDQIDDLELVLASELAVTDCA